MSSGPRSSTTSGPAPTDDRSPPPGQAAISSCTPNPGHHDHVQATLQTLLDGRAEVRSVTKLIQQGVFGPVISE